MSFLKSLSIAALAGHLAMAVANPGYCTTVNSLVTKYHQQAAATSFCSSYLSVPATTSTVTTTTTGVLSCSGPAAVTARAVNLEERNGKNTPVPKPYCLSSYTASKVLSAACSCLHPSGATVLSTSTLVSYTSLETPATFKLVVSDGAPSAGEYEKESGGGAYFDSSASNADILSINSSTTHLTNTADGSIAAVSDPFIPGLNNQAQYNIIFIPPAPSSSSMLQCNIQMVMNGGQPACGLFCAPPGGAGYTSRLENGDIWNIEDSDGDDPAFTPIVQAVS